MNVSSIFYRQSIYTGRKYMRSWVAVAIGVLAVVAFVAALVYATTWADHRACREEAEAKGYEYDWSVFGGCVYTGNPDQTVEIVT